MTRYYLKEFVHIRAKNREGEAGITDKSFEEFTKENEASIREHLRGVLSRRNPLIHFDTDATNSSSPDNATSNKDDNVYVLVAIEVDDPGEQSDFDRAIREGAIAVELKSVSRAYQPVSSEGISGYIKHLEENDRFAKIWAPNQVIIPKKVEPSYSAKTVDPQTPQSRPWNPHDAFIFREDQQAFRQIKRMLGDPDSKYRTAGKGLFGMKIEPRHCEKLRSAHSFGQMQDIARLALGLDSNVSLPLTVAEVDQLQKPQNRADLVHDLYKAIVTSKDPVAMLFKINVVPIDNKKQPRKDVDSYKDACKELRTEKIDSKQAGTLDATTSTSYRK